MNNDLVTGLSSIWNKTGTSFREAFREAITVIQQMKEKANNNNAF